MDIKQYISSGIIELYVMGLCSPEEEKKLEQLRLQYAELHTAILEYEIRMESSMMQHSTLPGTEVDERILRHLESMQPPVVLLNSEKASVRRINWLKPVAAAAILLFFFSAYYNYSLYNKNRKMANLINESANSPLPLSDYQVITDPAITPVAMYGVGTHTICRCTMFWDKKAGKAYIIIHHLPISSSYRDYQLWAEVGGRPVSVGIIQDDIRGRLIEMKNIPANATSFRVTLEKSGGNTSPDFDETYLEGHI